MTKFRNPVKVLLMVIIMAVLLRVSLSIYLGDTISETRAGTYDQKSYDRLAQRVVEGHGFSFATDAWPYARANQPTAFWSYIYTLFLAGFYKIFGHHPFIPRVVQAVIVGILMPWFSYRIGTRVFNQRTGLISATIVATYAYFVIYAGSLMTESFYIVCILWCIDVAMRIAMQLNKKSKSSKYLMISHGVELGIAMGLAVLLRQVIAVNLAILAVWLLWVAWRRKATNDAIKQLVIAGLVSLIFLIPFIYRNYQVFNRLTMPNTNAGFAFFWSNHPIYGTEFAPVLLPEHGSTYQELIPEELRELNEAELDKALLLQGLEFVKEDPKRYLQLSLSRIPVYFLFWPTRQSSLLSNAARVFSFGVLLPFMVSGILLAIRSLRRKRNVRAELVSEKSTYGEFLVLFFTNIIGYSILHLASWANVRYRLPVDIILIIFAAYAFDQLLLWWSLRDNSTSEALVDADRQAT